jgi:hypothetical protein
LVLFVSVTVPRSVLIGCTVCAFCSLRALLLLRCCCYVYVAGAFCSVSWFVVRCAFRSHVCGYVSFLIVVCFVTLRSFTLFVSPIVRCLRCRSSFADGFLRLLRCYRCVVLLIFAPLFYAVTALIVRSRVSVVVAVDPVPFTHGFCVGCSFGLRYVVALRSCCWFPVRFNVPR